VNILRALSDVKVFGSHFKRKKDTFAAWRTFLCALFALPMDAEQLELYRQCTGRTEAPTTPAREAWLVVGRRGGKSFWLALIAVFIAVFKDWRPYLAPGEVATVMIVAADRKQARVILRYIRGILALAQMLKKQIINDVAEQVLLKNDVAIEVHAASFKTTRGYTVVAALLDEIAFWPIDENSASPDTEIINAIRPAMATIPGALLLAASSPHAKRGALWNSYRAHFSRDNDAVLVWKAPTRTMNPTVPESYIAAHMQEDEARARSEYLAEFRSDLQSFVAREIVETCVSHGIVERPRDPRHTYIGFCDPSGGSSDSFTLCIAHSTYATQTVTIDLLREVRPPFSPETVCEEFASTLKSYGCSKIVGDRFGGIWPVEQFARFGITYEQSARPKSDLYVDLLPLLNSWRIELLDQPRLISQLCALERRTARGGRDSIDHPPGAHDDVVNAVAGAASLCVMLGSYDCTRGWVDDNDDDDRDGARAWRAARLAAYLNSGGRVVL